MRIQRPWLVFGILLIPTAAGADDHRAGLFFGFSYAQGSRLLGIHGSVELTLPEYEHWSMVADFSRNSGSQNQNDITRVPFLFGVRYTAAWQDSQKVVPSGHFLVGGVHATGAEDGTDWAFAMGGGLDFLPLRSKSREGWGIRVQGDYIIRLGDADNFPRVSVGGLYRFKKRPTP
jgi:hypothetical protein